MSKVSLIIPVYRVRDQIVHCLNSVLAQTLEDLEVVLVDDHGPDDSIAVARRHLASYTGPKQFRFIETPCNSGPGAARNFGIEHTSGQYIAFLDSDDTLDPAFCERLLTAAEKADADIACGAISFDLPDGNSTVRHNPPVEDGPFEGMTKRRYLRQFKSYFTTYLYRKSLLLDNGIRFPDTHSAEDSCFLICSLLAARRIARDDQALYHYAIQPASISQRKDPSRWRNRLSSFRAMEAFARDKGLYRRYHGVIRLMIFKKGYLMAARDFLSNNLSK